MKTRMDRYSTDDDSSKRSQKNEGLYKNIYEEATYTNIEGITKIEKDSVIDIDKIRNLLRKKEEREPKKTIPTVILEPEVLDNTQEDVLKNYDIRDVILKAKEDKIEQTHDNFRKLRDTHYNILSTITVTDEVNNKSDDLKDLIDTMAVTTSLSKVDDEKLSLDILGELKDDEDFIEHTQEMDKILENYEKTQELKAENTFFTENAQFAIEDFEEITDMNKKLAKNGVLIKILLVFLIMVVIGMLIVIYYLFFR